jgi:hypothetical protein
VLLLVFGEGDGEERRVECRARPDQGGLWPPGPGLTAATADVVGLSVLVVLLLHAATASRTMAAMAQVAGCVVWRG